jgi:hypothetical protein
VRRKVGSLDSLRDMDMKSDLFKVKLTRVPHERPTEESVALDGAVQSDETTLKDVSTDSDVEESEDREVAMQPTDESRWALVMEHELDVPEKKMVV